MMRRISDLRTFQTTAVGVSQTVDDILQDSQGAKPGAVNAPEKKGDQQKAEKEKKRAGTPMQAPEQRGHKLQGRQTSGEP